MQLGDVMTRNVEVIDIDASLQEAAAKMKSLDVGLVPVCDGETIKGTLTDRDITIRAIADGHDPATTKVSDIMTTDLAYCYKDQEIEEAPSLMDVKQIRPLPILNRDQQLVGDTLKEVSRLALLRRS